MSEHIKGFNRDQTVLFPKTLDEYISQDNPARFIDAFVENLNLQSMGFTHATPAQTGRPSYDPKDLLKLYIYGYLNQIRSSRRLEHACKINLEAIWLMRQLTPDHKTIADFRKNNPQSIRTVFKEFVKVCIKLDLYGAELLAVDGSKFKAQNAKEKHFTQKTLGKRVELIEKSIQRYLKDLETADWTEDQNQAKRVWEDKVKALLAKKEKCETLLKKMKETGQNEVAFTDPECRLMKNRGAIDSCYNVHAAVDSKNHLIVEYNVNNAPSDNHELHGIAKDAKETLGVESIKAVADNGFFDSGEIEQCLKDGIVPFVALKHSPAGGGGNGLKRFSLDRFVYDEATDVYVCPGGARLEFYYDAVVEGRRARIYRSKVGACFSCRFFGAGCTTNRLGRWIWRRMPLAVMVEMSERLRLNPDVMDKRKTLVEHPFGTLKRALGGGYLLLRGLRKVVGEAGLLMLAYNIRRALNILGPATLSAAFGRLQG